MPFEGLQALKAAQDKAARLTERVHELEERTRRGGGGVAADVPSTPATVTMATPRSPGGPQQPQPQPQHLPDHPGASPISTAEHAAMERKLVEWREKAEASQREVASLKEKMEASEGEVVEWKATAAASEEKCDKLKGLLQRLKDVKGQLEAKLRHAEEKAAAG